MLRASRGRTPHIALGKHNYLLALIGDRGGNQAGQKVVTEPLSLGGSFLKLHGIYLGFSWSSSTMTGRS